MRVKFIKNQSFFGNVVWNTFNKFRSILYSSAFCNVEKIMMILKFPGSKNTL